MRRTKLIAARRSSNDENMAQSMSSPTNTLCVKRAYNNELTSDSVIMSSVIENKKFCAPKRNHFVTPRAINKSNTKLPKCITDVIIKQCFRVLYTKRSRKKHKIYSDGILVSSSNKYELLDSSGKSLVKRQLHNMAKLEYGSEFEISSWQVEVCSSIDVKDFDSGIIFIHNISSLQTSINRISNANSRKSALTKRERVVDSINESTITSSSSSSSSSSHKSIISSRRDVTPRPRNDPNADEALVLFHPLKLDTSQVCVVMDTFIANRLRPHQRSGVQFIYSCLMGHSNPGYYGAILADEMGLGKTVQSLATVWTLLKDSPRPSLMSSVATRALLICPSSLVDNWAAECKKWLGSHRLAVVSMQSTQSSATQEKMIQDFVYGRRSPILIISYELARKFSTKLSQASRNSKTHMDGGLVMVCDEGHRLKNAGGNRTIRALNAIGTRRRLLLTGTPIQNNLDEMFAMCDFANPGQLGQLDSFRNNFARPISSCCETSSDEAKQICAARRASLHNITSRFLLRRTADILSKYLPDKIEIVLFVKLTSLQTLLYKRLLHSKTVKRLLHDKALSASTLSLLIYMRKLCNHPSLIYPSETNNHHYLADDNGESIDEEESEAIKHELKHLFPDDYNPDNSNVVHSAKLIVLANILRYTFEQEPDTKVVIVSNFTATLNVIEKLLHELSFRFLRLDGQTPGSKRQSLVRRFNIRNKVERAESEIRVFLLSSRAGGVGLNLIGSNRLVLFDPDWNPANDSQAMARIWRDGQTRTCSIYRLICAGALDEHILRRQLQKLSLATLVNDDHHSSVKRLSRDELKLLFTLNETVPYCQSHPIGVMTNNDENHHENKNANGDKIDDDLMMKNKSQSKWRTHCTLDETEDGVMKSLSQSIADDVSCNADKEGRLFEFCMSKLTSKTSALNQLNNVH